MTLSALASTFGGIVRRICFAVFRLTVTRLRNIVINQSPQKTGENAMSTGREQYEVVSVSLPRNLVRRANALIPKTRRSRIIANMLTAFLDSIARKQLEREYTAYYAQRSDREAQEERDLLSEWKMSDDEAWAILEKEEASGRRKAG
jgi:hypothetical protein